MKETFKSIQFICSTADIWSARNKSYLGITGHYIEPKTLARKSVVLSCKRIKYSHTFDEIAKGISTVHSDFGITKQVVATVTDNASNFGKAFKIYSLPDSANTVTEQADYLNDIDDIDIEVINIPVNDNED